MDTVTGNKIIAEFDMLSKVQPPGSEPMYSVRGYLKSASELPYHTSWDWLMPVVEKISEYGVWHLRPQFVTLKSFNIDRKDVDIFNFSTSQMDWETDNDEPVEWIFMVHHIVIKFIQWYNQHPTNP